MSDRWLILINSVSIIANCITIAMLSDQMQSLSSSRTTHKSIWFWQVNRYLKDGWAVSWECYTINPISWVIATIEVIRPTAQKNQSEV